MPKRIQQTREKLYHFHQQNPQFCGFLAVFFKISLAVAVITIFAINFSTALDDNRKLEELQEESLFSSASSLVLEDSAIERGLSLVYVASHRQNHEFRRRLDEQRGKFDKSIREGLREMKETVKFSDELDVVRMFEDWVEALPDFRDRIDDPREFNMTYLDVIDYYTQINSLLIYAVAEFTAETDGDVAKRALAWKHLLFEYDSLEKQRCLATSVLVCGQEWPTEAHVLFTRDSGRVMQAQASFSFLTTPSTWEKYMEVLASDIQDFYEEVRTILEEEGGKDGGIAAREAMYGRGWGEEVDFWDLFGVYLGVIGEFREESLRDLEEYSDQALDETRDRLVTNGIGLGIGIVACVYILLEAGYTTWKSWERRKKVKELDSKFAAEAKDVDEWSPT